MTKNNPKGLFFLEYIIMKPCFKKERKKINLLKFFPIFLYYIL